MNDQQNKSTKNDGDWSFEVKIPSESDTANQKTEEVLSTRKGTGTFKNHLNTKSVNQKKRENLAGVKSNTLEFDYESLPRESLTRAQMAERLKAEENLSDVFQYAHPIKRLIACMLDLFVYVASVYVSRFFLSPFFSILNAFADHYRLELLFSRDQFLTYGNWFLFFFNYFFLFAVLTAFYNRTFGKKILGILVREEERFSLSVSHMITREMVFKPLSVLTVIGVVMSLFSSRRQTLHDRMSKTLVIED